ncbi:MAG TPA: aspartate--tRNA(Asn) ligase [Thermomicrobiaceae bacterium]|nr:aspartate--tRNA(Asn) ligase [Thermomicrobiaceae bacterium]
MERIATTELLAHAGERVRLAGWLERLRRLGSIDFLILRDGAGSVQVVIDSAELREQLAGLPAESVLAVEGLAAAAPQAPGGVELRAERLEVIAAASESPPFDLFRPTIPAQLPTILDHAPVALRHARSRALFRLQAASVRGFRATLDALGFVEIHTPKLVASATESGANVFPVDYFGRTAYLAQSPQFYKQIMVGVFERVYEVGPVFRAEPHDTPRHLNEYISLDAEMGFIEDHTTVMSVLTQVLAGMVQAVGQEQAALATLGVELPVVPARIPAIHFTEALELISHATGEDVRGEPDLAPAHERWLGEWVLREHGTEFLFVVGYPAAKRPFYTHPDPARPGYTNGFDLLFRGLELVTGGQRLSHYEDYLAALAARGQDPEPLAGYLEAFKHGMPPHGGFALGLERWIARLTGAANIRETTLFPRDLNRLTP